MPTNDAIMSAFQPPPSWPSFSSSLAPSNSRNRGVWVFRWFCVPAHTCVVAFFAYRKLSPHACCFAEMLKINLYLPISVDAIMAVHSTVKNSSVKTSQHTHKIYNTCCIYKRLRRTFSQGTSITGSYQKPGQLKWSSTDAVGVPQVRDYHGAKNLVAGSWPFHFQMWGLPEMNFS